MSEPYLAEIRIMGFNFNPRGWAQCDGQILPIDQNQALQYMTSGYNEPISMESYDFKPGMGYGVNAYTKGSLFIEMLKYVVGEETFDRINKEYFRRWKFKHVTEERYKRVCEDVYGKDLTWFFDQWLHKADVVDYSLGKVKKEKQNDNSIFKRKGKSRL